MKNVSVKQEPTILDVIRELEKKKEVAPLPSDRAGASSPPELDPAKLRESIKEKLDIVDAVKKTKYARLVEGACKKSMSEIQDELKAALLQLDELESGMASHEEEVVQN